MAKLTTSKTIEAAIVRIQKRRPQIVSKNRRLSIKAVAEESGLSPASIHNRYPELAEKIRGLNNKNSPIQLQNKLAELQQLKQRIKALQIELTQTKQDLAKALSINLRLQRENNQFMKK